MIEVCSAAPQGGWNQFSSKLQSAWGDWESVADSDAKLLIETVPPHRILSASAGFLDLFDYNAKEICGCSLRNLQGPRTDLALLEELLRHPSQPNPNRMVFYSR